MEFRQIRYFLAIHEAGSFLRAARGLGLTQPALSRQMSLLERELGQVLFERRARSLHLTASGETFLTYAVRMNDLWREMLDGLNPEAENLHGEYSISTGGTIAAWVLPPVLSRIRRGHRSLSFRVYEGDLEESRERLVRGEVDIGILTGQLDESGLLSRPLFTDRIVPVAARTHPVFRRKPLTIASLAEDSFVFFHPTSAIRRAVEKRLRETRPPLRPRIAMELRSIESVIRSIEAGHGIGFVSELSLNPRLRVLPFEELVAERTFYVSFRRHHRRSLDRLMELIEQYSLELRRPKTTKSGPRARSAR